MIEMYAEPSGPIVVVTQIYLQANPDHAIDHPSSVESPAIGDEFSESTEFLAGLSLTEPKKGGWGIVLHGHSVVAFVI